MRVILLALWQAGLFTRTEPHMELLRSLTAKTPLKVFGDTVGIDEMAVHTTGNITGCNPIKAVGIVKCITFNEVFGIAEDGITQLLIISHLRRHNEEIATSHGIHQHRDTTFFSCLTDITSQIIVECGTRIGMTGGLSLFIVMTKLDNNVITRPNLLQNLVPSALIQETLR